MMVAAGALAIVLGAQLSLVLPHSPIPQTAQTLAVLLVAVLLGPARGVSAVALYILLGILGLPVFASGGSGFERLLGPTGGFLVGFLLAAWLAGSWSEAGWTRRLPRSLLGMLLAHATILLTGGLWLARSIGWAAAVGKGIQPFLVAALMKSMIAALVATAIARRFARPKSAT